MLHQKADAGDSDPAAEAQQNRLSAGFDQLRQVGVEADGGHGPDDEELAQVLERGEHGRRRPQGRADGGDDRGEDEKQDKPGEDPPQPDPAAGLAGLPRAEERQHQGDGDDGERPGELDNGGGLQGVGAVDGVPGGRSGGDRPAWERSAPQSH